MAFDAGSIACRMGIDISPFTQGMLQATSIAQVFPQTITNFIANPLLGVIDIAQKAASALVDMFTTATNKADDAGDLAANVGVSVEALSGLSLVAKDANVTMEGVADAFSFLGRSAADGSKSFAAIGVNARDAAGNLKPLDALMMEVADGLKALPEGGMRSAVAVDLLGRSGRQLVGTLAQGSAAIREQIGIYDRMGAVITTKSVESADRWNHMVGELGTAWEGFKNLIAEPIRDALMPYLNNLLDWVETHPEEMKNIAHTVATAIVNDLVLIGNVATSVAQKLESVGRALDKIADVFGGSSIRAAFRGETDSFTSAPLLTNREAAAFGGKSEWAMRATGTAPSIHNYSISVTVPPGESSGQIAERVAISVLALLRGDLDEYKRQWQTLIREFQTGSRSAASARAAGGGRIGSWRWSSASAPATAAAAAHGRGLQLPQHRRRPRADATARYVRAGDGRGADRRPAPPAVGRRGPPALAATGLKRRRLAMLRL
jgi:hypothetical protein